MASTSGLRKAPFLTGVFLIAFSSLQFQILETRIMSVIAWYSMAFFAISIAMLGMTVGAVWVYLRRERLQPEQLPVTLSNFALLTALAMPASMVLQFCLITAPALSLTMVVSWALLSAVMAAPYVFAGVVVCLALTRSPFPTGQVYGVDLLGAALGCVSVLVLLNVVDGPSAVFVTGAISGLSSLAFAEGTEDRRLLPSKPWWRQPVTVVVALLAVALFNALSPIGFSPIMAKDTVDFRGKFGQYEKWNSYSRIRASRPRIMPPDLWASSSRLPADLRVPKVVIGIDDLFNASNMFHYDGTNKSIDFLKCDLVNLAYRLPGIHKSAVIGVGGGQDILSAHLFGVTDITGVELNPIIVDLHTRDPFYKSFSNLTALPNLKLHVDDARSWFAATDERFDLVQMTVADTWAATGAGAFSLSENGLYTLEGWRAFLKTLNPNGIFTVSRWYAPGEVNETGRMIGLATAALLDAGVKDARPHLFVATNGKLATLVLSRSPFTVEELRILHDAVRDGGFAEVLSPERPSESELLSRIVGSRDLASLNQVLGSTYLDLTVPTDERPFFFNQLRIFDIRGLLTVLRVERSREIGGVWWGNLVASAVLLIILFISIVAVIVTILVPLRSAARQCARPLAVAGSAYFSLIGMGFMLAEIALLQYFSVYLGHPIYSLSVCLFSLILASGLGSLASDWLKLSTRAKLLAWGSIVVAYLAVMQWILPSVFQATTDRERLVRIGVSLAAIMPLGFLLGFAFPTGMRLVSAIDTGPTPWFWGINGATGVLASVLSVIISMSFGINVTMLAAAACYLLVIPTALALLAMRPQAAQLP
jgi:hypothetical protein